MPDQAGLREDKEAEALHAAAVLAHARTQYDAALALWAELRRLRPRSSAGFIGAIRTAKAAGREDLVAPLLQDGQDAAKRHAERIAQEAAAPSWEAADEEWHKLMRAPPVDRQAELAAALAALQQRHLGRGSTETALARLDVVRARFPRYVKACIEQVLILRKLEQYDRALVLSSAYVTRFADNDKLVLAHVSLLNAQHRYEEAYRAVLALRAESPPLPKIEAAYVHALSQIGKLDEAEEAGARAMADFPDDESLAREYASVASRRGEWAEAMARLRAAEAKWPQSGKIKKRIAGLRQQMPEDDVPPQSADEAAAIFSRFESLGGSQIGCEFGLVQRDFGSTSLGLLRWTTMERLPAIAGILNRFEGLTEPGNISLKTYRPHGDREEWVVTDERYGFNSHTFIEVKDAQEDKLLVQTLRRLSFLRGKLDEDLEIGTKIFVYKSVHPTTDEQLFDIFRAVRQRGPASLLCIIRSDDAHPTGTVRKLADGLYVGYIGYFMYETVPEGCPPTNNLAWRHICTQVVAAIDGEKEKEAVLF